MSHKADFYDRRAERVQARKAEIESKFTKYCKQKDLSIREFRHYDTYSEGVYNLWETLHDYAPSLWGSMKRSQLEVGLVKEIVNTLKHHLTEKILSIQTNKCDAQEESIPTYIQNSINDSIQMYSVFQSEASKNKIMSLLCLLSGDTFNLLRDHYGVRSDIPTIQTNFYMRIAQELSLPPNTARDKIRSEWSKRLNPQNTKASASLTEAEAVAYQAVQEIEVLFRQYFVNLMYTLTNINICDAQIFGRNFPIQQLVEHLEDTSYKKDLEVAMHILAPGLTGSPVPSAPAQAMVEEYDASLAILASFENTSVTTAASIAIAESLDSHSVAIATASAEQVVNSSGKEATDQVKYCIDQMLLIPSHAKGPSDFYETLKTVIEILCRHYSSDVDFCTGFNEIIADLSLQKTEFSTRVKDEIAEIKKNYLGETSASAGILLNTLQKKMFEIKKTYIENAHSEECKQKVAQLDTIIKFLRPFIPAAAAVYNNQNPSALYSRASAPSAKKSDAVLKK